MSLHTVKIMLLFGISTEENDVPSECRNDLSGLRFGRIKVIKFIPDTGKYHKFLCLCDCGNAKIIIGQSLLRGHTVSCGCYHREKLLNSISHGDGRRGKKRSPTYSSWASMMTRCEWGNHPMYERYGARGIRVCERWRTYENFKEDMGERPPGTSIDRIDNSVGYEPSNCRWATRKEQALNTTRTIKVTYNGEVVCVYDLCNSLGISRTALRSRAVRRGRDYVEALRSMGVMAFGAEHGVEFKE